MYHLRDLIPLYIFTAITLEKVTSDFPFWEACHKMWHGNPAYNAQVFNPDPAAHRTSDLLFKLEHHVIADPVVPTGLSNDQDAIEGPSPELDLGPITAVPTNQM